MVYAGLYLRSVYPAPGGRRVKLLAGRDGELRGRPPTLDGRPRKRITFARGYFHFFDKLFCEMQTALSTT